jgi:hypothetical protein
VTLFAHNRYAFHFYFQKNKYPTSTLKALKDIFQSCLKKLKTNSKQKMENEAGREEPRYFD